MNICDLKAWEVKEKLLNKEVSSREIVQSYIDRIEEVEKDTKAFITMDKEMALKEADGIDNKIKNKEKIGALGGLPIGIKDNIITKDLRTTAGSKMLEDFIPPYDGTVISKIKEAHGIILGKTNMDEFGLKPSTETSYFGATRNSSSEKVWDGAATALVKGEVALALSSDTNGAVRQSASYSGLVGIKPTYGSVSRYGLIALADTLDQVGVLGKDVRDAILMLNTISGYDRKDATMIDMDLKGIGLENNIYSMEATELLKGMKIALPKEYISASMDSKIKEKFNKSIRLFEDLGAVVEEVSIPHLNYALETYEIIAASEISSNLSRYDGIRYGYRAQDYSTLDELYINTRTEGFGEEIKKKIILGTYLLSSRYGRNYLEQALKVRNLIKKDFDKVFKDYHIILSPVSSSLAFKEDANEKNLINKDELFTVPVNLAGLCAISVPNGKINGESIGLQIIGDRFKEINIIKAALGFERMVKGNDL